MDTNFAEIFQGSAHGFCRENGPLAGTLWPYDKNLCVDSEIYMIGSIDEGSLRGLIFVNLFCLYNGESQVDLISAFKSIYLIIFFTYLPICDMVYKYHSQVYREVG